MPLYKSATPVPDERALAQATTPRLVSMSRHQANSSNTLTAGTLFIAGGAARITEDS